MFSPRPRAAAILSRHRINRASQITMSLLFPLLTHQQCHIVVLIVVSIIEAVTMTRC